MVLVQHDRDLGKPQDAPLDHISKGAGKFYGYGIRSDAFKQVLSSTCEL
jgi:hypothetical protein